MEMDYNTQTLLSISFLYYMIFIYKNYIKRPPIRRMPRMYDGDELTASDFDI